MNLNRVLKNCKDCKNSFFNVNKGDLVSICTLKNNIKFYYESGIIYFYDKKNKPKKPSRNYYLYYLEKRVGDIYPYLLSYSVSGVIEKIINLDLTFFMKFQK